MTSAPICIGPAERLADAMQLMAQRHVRHLPVVDVGGKLIGLLSDRDARTAAPSPLLGGPGDAGFGALTVGQVMVRSPWTVGPKYRVHDAVTVFVQKKYGALPVVEDGKLVGILTPIDLLRGWVAP